MEPAPFKSPGDYGPSPDPTADEEDSPMLGSKERLSTRQPRNFYQKHWVITTASFILTNILSLISGGLLVHNPRCSSVTHYASSTGQESLVFKEAAIQRGMKLFKNEFFGDYENSPFRQDASPAVDDAWGSLINYEQSDYIIPYEEGIRSGLTERHMQVSDKYGGGFVASTEGGHNLHCLNFLRKALWYNFDYYEPQVLDLRRLPKHHITHCLDIIRLSLMCNYDTKWLGYVWYNMTHPKPFPDMTGNHMCKNFDTIQERLSAIPNKPGKEQPADFYVPPPDPEYILKSIP